MGLRAKQDCLICHMIIGSEITGVAALPIPHRLTVRVYYEDTDFSGVVYHASYLRFLERGRTEFCAHLVSSIGEILRTAAPTASISWCAP